MSKIGIELLEELVGRRLIPAFDDVEAIADEAAIDQFAEALSERLRETRTKGRKGWWSDEFNDLTLSEMLRQHVHKGDPLDVAAIAMFLFIRGEKVV